MKEIKHLLGQRIKELRNKRGLSQQQLAEIVNIDQRNLSNIECGVTFPTRSLSQIANALNVTLPELFDFDYLPQDENSMKNYIVSRLENLDSENITTLYRLVKIMQ